MTVNKKSGQSLGKLADAAFREAARDVVELAVKTGTPVIVWKDGAIRAVDPKSLRLSRPGRKRRTTGE
jgi:hypothetical protein